MDGPDFGPDADSPGMVSESDLFDNDEDFFGVDW